MVKVSSNDALAILRRFKIASEEHVPRHIEQLKSSAPDLTNTLVSFRFQKQGYYALFDDEVHDDPVAIMDFIQTAKQGITGELLENPNDHLTTYGLPFKGKDVYLFSERSAKRRLDIELSVRYPDTSRSTWQKRIKAGHVTINGVVQESVKYDVSPHDTIAITELAVADFTGQTLPIIYIDDNVIVINKPVGVLSHAKGVLDEEFTVAEFFRGYTDYGLDTNRPGIVHRLDRDTSGIMIGARNEAAARYLQKQFADRRAKKRYVAALKGVPKNPSAEIRLPIGRNPSAPSTFRVDPKGKSADTSYSTLAEHDGKTLVLLKPTTGRTHQLRVHMQYMKTPILGDRVYGKAADRLYLHALGLEITVPGGERKTFTAPLPAEFGALFPEDDIDELLAAA